VPLILMALGMGNVQGFGILKSEGFAPPIKLATVVMGAGTLFNSLFGGHLATLQTNGTAIMAGKEAGPQSRRYMATVLASILALGMAIGAGSLGALLGLFPAGLMPALAGLAVMSSLAEGMRKSMTAEFPVSGFVAMMIAASSLSVAGIGAPLWGFVGGVGIAIALERQALRRYWRDASEPEKPATQPAEASA
jgi:benzoate membrane transport protein